MAATRATSSSGPSVVVVDNYDSFTYNLVQYLESLGAHCSVWLNDRCSVAQIREEQPSGVLISPGPGTPDDAGISLDLIRELKSELPIFGVCLGHQAIAQALGGEIVRADRIMHGKVSQVRHDGRGLLKGIPSPFLATRYHSLIVKPSSLPDCLVTTARSEWDEIMGLAHHSLPLVGVQFHPESILTDHGLKIVENWLGSLCTT